MAIHHPPPAPAEPQTRAARVVGAAAIGLAASIIVQYAIPFATGAPAYGAPMSEVLAYHADHRSAVALAVGLEALNLPLLLGFLAGLHRLVGRRGADWSRLALAAGAVLSAVLALYAVLWVGVVLAAGELADPSAALTLAWQLHAAALALAFPALGTTFIGAALAAHAAGMTPHWLRLLAVVGGVLLIAAGAASLAIADGSMLVMVGLPGYFGWPLWLLVTGLSLVRGRTNRRSVLS